MGVEAKLESANVMLFRYGGILFMDGKHRPVGINAMYPQNTADGNDVASKNYMNFRNMQELHPLAAKYLKRQRRFAAVTMPSMVAEGAVRFAWVNPRESLCDVFPFTGEAWKLGAFVYEMNP